MAEEAQELTVTNVGQPDTGAVELLPATSSGEEAQELTVVVAEVVTIELEPASD